MPDEQLRLKLHRPKQRADGQLTATVQVWKLDESGHEASCEYDRFWNVSNPQYQDKLINDLSDLGIPQAEQVLHQHIGEARRVSEERDDGDGPKQPEPSKYHSQAVWVAQKLVEEDETGEPSGRFLVTDTDQTFYSNCVTDEPVRVDSSRMWHVLWKRLPDGFNRSHPGASYIHEHLKHFALEYGEPVTLHKGSWYDRKRNLLYINCGSGQMLRLDGQSVTTLENGTDGVQFVSSAIDEPWTYTPDHEWSLRQDLLKTYSFAEGEDSPFEPAEQQLMFLVWMLAFFFKSELPARPIAVAYGPRGSGKSHAFRHIGRILHGNRFNTIPVNGDKQKDFWVTLASRPFVVFDNNDAFVPWFQDAIAQVATGTEWATAQLYETAELVSYQIDAFVGITTRTPKFLRDDVADRSLFFLFDRLPEEKRRSDRDIYEMLETRRHLYLSELVDRANKVLATERPSTQGAVLRMADFAQLAVWIGQSMGMGDHISELLQRQSHTQNDLAAQENPIINALRAWLSSVSPNGGLNAGRLVTTSELYGELKAMDELTDRRGYPVGIKSANSLGRKLQQEREFIRTQFDYECREVGGRGKVNIFNWKGEGVESNGELV